MKTIIIYYSQARGNTRRIAKMAASALGADTAEIDTVVPYEGSYNDIVEQGQDEVETGYMPEIKPLNVDFKNYDRIILGTPTWWYTMAPAMKTFLTNNNFSGKEIVLFQTHGGWQGHVMEDMENLVKGKVVSKFSVQFDSTGGSELITPVSDVEKWIDSLK